MCYKLIKQKQQYLWKFRSFYDVSLLYSWYQNIIIFVILEAKETDFLWPTKKYSYIDHLV